MLVLARKEGETIRIGDDIVIHITGAKGRVEIGVEAPREINVIRGELKQKTVATWLHEETTV